MFFTIEGVKSFDTSTRKTLILGINLYVFQNILEIQLLKKIILSTLLTSTSTNLWLKSDSHKIDFFINYGIFLVYIVFKLP